MAETKDILLSWVLKHWGQILGSGTYVKEENPGLYVVIPVKLLAEEYGVSMEYIMYGKDIYETEGEE